MADLISFSPIHHRTINETQPKGILTNKTNTITTTTNQNNYQQQPKVYQPVTATAVQPPPTMPQPTAPAAAFTKPFRPRSASVHLQKSIGDADDERNPANPTLREHPRKVVAFGRTTKVEDTIKSIKTTTLPYKPPVGSLKDIMDLRRLVENQSAQLQAQQEEIQKLKETINEQNQKYIFLLDSNTKFWAAFTQLKNQVSSSSTTDDSKKYNHATAKEKTKEIAYVSTISKPLPKDSIAVKKYKEIEQKKISNNEERQIVPAAAIKVASEIEKERTFSELERFLNANPNRAKEVQKLAKLAQKKNQQKSESEESESDRRQKHQRKGGYHHQSVVEEKITVERKVCKPRKVQDYLSSTIDDSLEKYDIHASNVDDRNHRHHNRRQQQLPPTPTIREVTSSSSESEESVPQRHHHTRRGETNQKHSSLDATAMPDHFDDDDMSSDTEVTPQIRRNDRRHRVAERVNNRRR